MEKSLTELANLYGTDKGTIGPSQGWGSHNYTDVYEGYLDQHRSSPINFLEIGLGVTGKSWKAHIVHGRNSGGASLKMWRDYFPEAKIYGIDVNECSYLEDDRTKTFVADQGSVRDLNAFMEAIGLIEFDVIVDDGSHRPDHQQTSFNYFFTKLKRGGLYFIEDLLANGLGDRAWGRMACNDVKNTRSVFKHYLEHGQFLEPNALTDSSYLEENIDSLRFHCPDFRVKHVLNSNIRRPLKRVIRYKSDSESICVIKKR